MYLNLYYNVRQNFSSYIKFLSNKNKIKDSLKLPFDLYTGINIEDAFLHRKEYWDNYHNDAAHSALTFLTHYDWHKPQNCKTIQFKDAMIDNNAKL